MNERSGILVALGLIPLLAGAYYFVLALTSRRAHGAVDRVEAAVRAATWVPWEGESTPAHWSLRPWMQDLAAMGFVPLGRVRPRGGKGILWIFVDDPRTTVGWILDRPRSRGFDTAFTDGTAVETMLACPAVRIDRPDLQVHTLDHSTETRSGLRKHQLAVAAFAGGHGIPSVIDDLDTWLEHDAEHRQRFARHHAEGQITMLKDWSRRALFQSAILVTVGSSGVALGLAFGGQ